MRKINVRFESQKDFEDWNTRQGLNLDSKMKTFNLDTGDFTHKKETNRKSKPGVYEQSLEHYDDMPEYHSENVKPYAHIVIEFSDVSEMESLIEQDIKDSTKSVYVPKRPLHRPFTYKRVLSGNGGGYATA